MVTKKLATLLRTLRLARDEVGALAGSELSVARLFDATIEATLIIDAVNGVVIEANPAAADLLDCSRERLVGRPWLGAFAAASVLGLTKLESRAHADGVTAAVRATVRDQPREVDVTLSLVRAAPAAYLIAHLTPTEAAPTGVGAEDGAPMSLDVIEQAGDGFVVTDPGLRILYSNPAFAQMAGLRQAPDVVGKSLTRWVEFMQQDLDTLKEQMRTREAVTTLRASLCPAGPAPSSRLVELTAVAVPDEPQRCYGFWIRQVPAAAGSGAATPSP